MRDIESLCAKAGLGKLSKTTASRIYIELRERFEQFKRRDLYDVQVAALFLDAVFLAVRCAPRAVPQSRHVTIVWRRLAQTRQIARCGSPA